MSGEHVNTVLNVSELNMCLNWNVLYLTGRDLQLVL